MKSASEREAFLAALSDEKLRVDGRLREVLDEFARGPAPIEDAVRYVVLNGGKRLRPILCLWSHDAACGSARDGCLDTACAIECLHTYSLVHDDLPCMDDDDMRRGRASCHKKYGEAVAVLTGDALLTISFEILASLPRRHGVADAAALEVARIVSRAAGTGGLVGGQILDIGAAAGGNDIAYVEQIHSMKTAALISASVECGAVLAGVKGEERASMRAAGEKAGRAFQIIDDVLDVESDEAALGKTPGKDARAGKTTYPSLAGTLASRARAADLVAGARGGFREGPAGDRVRSLLDFMVERRR
jgi:geranylgeranyl diphosphate synthase type II